MTTDGRRAYMAEYMRAYRATHKTTFSAYERARNKLRKLKLTTQEQETAKRALFLLGQIKKHKGISSEQGWALSYAIGLIAGVAREPMGEGFGNLNPPTVPWTGALPHKKGE